MLVVYLQDPWWAEKPLWAGSHSNHVHSDQQIMPEVPPVRHLWCTELTETELDQEQLESETKCK